ncbi:hypothetical protein CRE_04557 [Caenorhabditis remanei]|uniref:Uncharacterized protein n=1 Tax=Caenorhabditis remanei TaxID=31234 RepID=E3LZ28_CAERE|nr:hypothetical protein CRE_04557 [Caenorhabditis remanei]
MELIDKVFQNGELLENILKNVSKDGMNHLSLRLVNKVFNSEMLRLIRRNHRGIYVSNVFKSVDDEWRMEEEDVTYDVAINNQKVNSARVYAYCRFLKEVAEVKICKLTIEALPVKYTYEDLHDALINMLTGSDYDIVEEFIGTKQICRFGCDRCSDIVNNGKCKNYGPLEEYIILHPHHFHCLLVSDVLLFQIAQRCITFSDEKEEALEKLDGMISPLISCDKLHLILTDSFGATRYRSIGEENQLSHSFPREVLDLMIVKWKVKSLKLEFQATDSETCTVFHYGDVFAKGSFDTPFANLKVSNYTLESVEIDLKCTEIVIEEMETFLNTRQPSPFDNLVANAKRLFPTRNMLVKFPNEYCLITPENIASFIPKLMKISEMEKDRNFNSTFRIYSPNNGKNYSDYTLNIPDILNLGVRFLTEEGEENNHFLLEKVVPIPVEEERLTLGNKCRWYGKSFQLKNEMTNNRIQFQIIFEEEFLEMLSSVRDKLKQVGFLEHYLP